MKKYIAAVIVGAILTYWGHQVATLERGYVAIGGEMFMIPLALMAVSAFENAKELLEESKELFRKDEEEWL